MSMKLISTVTVGSGGAAEIAFSNIPNTYTDLYLVASLRTTATTTYSSVALKFNGSTANASYRFLQGSGSGLYSASGTSFHFIGDVASNALTSNTFGNMSVIIPNAFSSSQNKSYSSDAVSENNATTAYQMITAGLWSSNSAITSLTLYEVDSKNFVEYSSASLYGITKGSDGVTTAT